MNDIELMLVTIGDLEFSRRKLTQQLAELEKKQLVAESNNNSDPPAAPIEP